MIPGILWVAGLAFSGFVPNGPTSTPNCQWFLQTQGDANAHQIGLVRCYVKAQAQGDLKALNALRWGPYGDSPPVLANDLSHTADANSGIADATFKPNQSDDADLEVEIVYANGVHDDLEMALANPESGDSWRLTLNTGPGRVP